jgi:hypothetical protein
MVDLYFGDRNYTRMLLLFKITHGKNMVSTGDTG